MVKLLYSEVCVPGSNQGSGIQFFISQQLALPLFGARQPNHFCLFIFALVVALTRIKIYCACIYPHRHKISFLHFDSTSKSKAAAHTSKSKAAAHAEPAYFEQRKR